MGNGMTRVDSLLSLIVKSISRKSIAKSAN